MVNGSTVFFLLLLFCYTIAVLKIHISIYRWRHHQ